MTGIASPAPILERLEGCTKQIDLLSFDDHHNFTHRDIQLIKERFHKLKGEHRLIITTEKDATRLINHPALDKELKPFIYTLPIEIEILQNQQDKFNQHIIDYVRENTRNRSLSRSKMHTSPETAIILGTGLGSLANEITEKYEIKYSDIPNFPVSTVEGHSGKLIFGKLGNKDIMAMQGRFHYYEGYSMKEVTFPVRVMRELGIKTLFVSNAKWRYK